MNINRIPSMNAGAVQAAELTAQGQENKPVIENPGVKKVDPVARETIDKANKPAEPTKSLCDCLIEFFKTILNRLSCGKFFKEMTKAKEIGKEILGNDKKADQKAPAPKEDLKVKRDHTITSVKKPEDEIIVNNAPGVLPKAVVDEPKPETKQEAKTEDGQEVPPPPLLPQEEGKKVEEQKKEEQKQNAESDQKKVAQQKIEENVQQQDPAQTQQPKTENAAPQVAPKNANPVNQQPKGNDQALNKPASPKVQHTAPQNNGDQTNLRVKKVAPGIAELAQKVSQNTNSPQTGKNNNTTTQKTPPPILPPKLPEKKSSVPPKQQPANKVAISVPKDFVIKTEGPKEVKTLDLTAFKNNPAFNVIGTQGEKSNTDLKAIIANSKTKKTPAKKWDVVKGATKGDLTQLADEMARKLKDN